MFDRHREAHGVGVDSDGGGIACDTRIGPDLELSTVRSDSCKAECRCDVDIGGKSAGTLARAAIKHLQRLFEPDSRDPALAEMGRAVESRRWLARHHLDRMNRAFGSGANRIKAHERSRRHENTRVLLARAIDEVVVFQQLRDRKRHENAPLVDGADGDLAEQSGRQAFDDNVTVVCELGSPADGNVMTNLRQGPLRLLCIAYSYRCEC